MIRALACRGRFHSLRQAGPVRSRGSGSPNISPELLDLLDFDRTSIFLTLWIPPFLYLINASHLYSAALLPPLGRAPLRAATELQKKDNFILNDTAAEEARARWQDKRQRVIDWVERIGRFKDEDKHALGPDEQTFTWYRWKQAGRDGGTRVNQVNRGGRGGKAYASATSDALPCGLSDLVS